MGFQEQNVLDLEVKCLITIRRGDKNKRGYHYSPPFFLFFKNMFTYSNHTRYHHRRKFRFDKRASQVQESILEYTQVCG